MAVKQPKKNSAAVTLGRKGGKKRAETQTAEQLTEQAKKAAEARWGKAKRQDAPAKKRLAARVEPAAESLKVHGDKLDTKRQKK